MALAVGIIASILLMDQVYRFIPFLQSSGMEVKSVFLMILFSLPTTLMIAIPFGIMIAVYAGIYRVSSDSELIAMRAAGISLKLLFAPVLLLSTLAAAFVLALNFWLSPMGVYNLDMLKFTILKKQTRINLREGQINNIFGQKLIYIEKMEENRLSTVFIADWELKKQGVTYIEAEFGSLRFDAQEKIIYLLLHRGKIHTSENERDYSIVTFKNLDYAVSPPPERFAKYPRRFRSKSGKLRHKLELTDFALTVGDLRRKMREEDPDSDYYYELLDEYHSRIVMSLSCIVFALFALPMGMFNPRNPKTGRFLYMLGMVIAYYSLFSRFRWLVSEGDTHAAILYSPLLLAVLTGLVSYIKINYDLTSFIAIRAIPYRK